MTEAEFLAEYPRLKIVSEDSPLVERLDRPTDGHVVAEAETVAEAEGFEANGYHVQGGIQYKDGTVRAILWKAG